MLNPTTRFARFTSQVVVISLLALYAPAETIGEVSRKAAKDLASAPAMKASRDLSAPEMKKLSGKAGANPYWSGSSKWGINIEGVDVTTGNFSMSATDLSFEGGYGIPVAVSRTYSMNNAEEGPLGYGWTLSVDIRTTAGGVMKSASAPVRSVPTSFKERPTDQKVRLATPSGTSQEVAEPTDAVIATDASGFEETMQRDVDGIITPPSWDQNIIDTVNELITLNGNTYTVTKSQTVQTPDGATYQYSKHGFYDGGVINGRDAGSGNSAIPEPSNILKIDSVTDRHGNTTNYTYFGDGQVSYYKLNGTAKEDRLQKITMPNGHELTFTWGTGATLNRIVNVKDNVGSGQRTVTYTYDSNNYLKTEGSPMGRTTTYTYEVPYRPTGNSGPAHMRGDAFDRGASLFLKTIEDPRGMVTKLFNVQMNRCLVPYFVSAGQGICTVSILHPNLTSVHLWPESSIGGPNGGFATQLSAGGGEAGVKQFIDTWFYALDGTNADDYTVPGAIGVTPLYYDSLGKLTAGQRWTDFNDASVTVQGVTDTNAGSPEGTSRIRTLVRKILRSSGLADYNLGGIPDEKIFSVETGHLLLAVTRPDEHSRIESQALVNFMGSPLLESCQEFSGVEGNSQGTSVITRNTFYAYWGKNKYYQQKAVVDPSGRVAWTDYYDNTTAPGQKGQTKEVVRSGVDSSVSNTFSPMPSTDGWRNSIAPTSNYVAAAKFDGSAYNSKGQVLTVDKLQKVVTGIPTYVRTVSDYGNDGSPMWGNAIQVTEASGVSNVQRITKTNAQDSAGRATDIEDANRRRFVTVYNLDGQVVSVTETDNDTTSSAYFEPQPIVTYQYGDVANSDPLVANGMAIFVEDGQSSHTQEIKYISTSGSGLGQVDYVLENGSDSSTAYRYNANGERSRVRYFTRDMNSVPIYRNVTYNNYLAVGSVASPGRVFQNMTLCTSTSSMTASWTPTTEQMLYQYDVSGRLESSAFAPTMDSSWASANSNTGIQSDASHMTSYAKAIYTYDQGGRTADVQYKWVKPGVSETLLKEASYEYNLTKGLRTKLTLSDPASSAKSYVDDYGYDSNLDYLTSVNYHNSQATNIWGYDASGNRTVENYGTAKTSQFDELNRITTSQSGAKTYVHDKVGNRITSDQGGARQTMTWDATNRMTAIIDGATPNTNPQIVWGTNSEYTYRADGLRTMKVVHPNVSVIAEIEEVSSFYDFNYLINDASTKYFYDGQVCSSESYVGYAGENQQTNGSYVNEDVTNYTLGARGIDMIEAVRIHGAPNDPIMSAGAKRSFPLYDGHGNMLATLIKSGTNECAISNEKRYDAWGAAFVQSGPGAALLNPNAAYCANLGHKVDDESGLTYMRARYYEPGSGRFVSEDPGIEGLNWYVYCHGNPINFVDRSGQMIETLGASVKLAQEELEKGAEDIEIYNGVAKMESQTGDSMVRNLANHIRNRLGEDRFTPAQLKDGILRAIEQYKDAIRGGGAGLRNPDIGMSANRVFLTLNGKPIGMVSEILAMMELFVD